MPTGSASIVIDRDPMTVFATVSDITRTGEWSPECTAGRWTDGAAGPTQGAKFEGDNKIAIAGLTLKKWTTTSEVTACIPGELFEFVAESYTTWRYEMKADGNGTRLTETYEFAAQSGLQKFMYETILRRPASMVNGMQRTLEKIKQHLESS